MNRVTWIFIAMFVSSVALAGSTHKIKMKSISYDPKFLQIKAGDSVEWANVSYTEHSATSDSTTPSAPDLAFDTGMVARKKTSKKIEFKKPGTYTYHCSMHGHSMSGKIEVTP